MPADDVISGHQRAL